MEHQKRIITALILFSLGLAAYLYFEHNAVIFLSALIAVLSNLEFLQMVLDKRLSRELRIFKLLHIALASAGIFIFSSPENIIPLYFVGLCIGSILFLSLLFCHFDKSTDNPLEVHLKDAVMQTFGFVYIACFMSFVPAIHALPHGAPLLLLPLLIIWGGDIGAYYGGKFMGKHLLSPQLSPKKTWEGSVSAIFVSLVACVVMQKYFLLEFSLVCLSLTAVLVSIAAQAGDLLESLIKRVAKVKDSGAIFPGHGGVFDRFDSLIAAAPLFYYLIALCR